MALADSVPLPRPRPPQPPVWSEPRSFSEAAGPDFKSAEVTSEPSDCRQRLEKIATVEPMPRLIGPGACGGRDMVALATVLLADRTSIEVKPGPVMRCEMAESLASWIRDEAAPRVAKLGTGLRAVETYDSFSCRGRNRVAGARLSEHGKGNAVDVRKITFADGRIFALTDVALDKELRDGLRESACRRFTTVLGPGSDGYHEQHIHLDIIARRNGYRICQWDVREKPAPKVPLPPEIPAKQDEAVADAPDANRTVPEAAGASSDIAADAANNSDATVLTIVAVPLPKSRPKPRHIRRKVKGGIHFPFNLFR